MKPPSPRTAMLRRKKLADFLRKLPARKFDLCEALAGYFRVNRDEAVYLMWFAYYGNDAGKVTPTQVADRLMAWPRPKG